MSQQYNYPKYYDVDPVPQPVTGTVTADQGAPNTTANAWPVKVSDGTDILQITAAGEATVSVTQPLPTGTNSIGQVTANAGTGNFTVIQPTGTNLHTVVDSGSVSASQSGAWTVTAVQPTGTNLHTVVDSGTVTANIGTTGGLALDASVTGLQQTQQSSSIGVKGMLMQGVVTSAAPGYSIDTVSPFSLTTGGLLRVDTGSVAKTVNQGTSNISQAQGWYVRVTDGVTNLSIGSNGQISTTAVGYQQAQTPAYNDYTGTPVTTGAYVQLVAATALETAEIEIFDSSGQALYLAVGAPGSEVDQMIIFPGGNGRVTLEIPAGSRVSVKAITATANAGFIAINFYAVF